MEKGNFLAKVLAGLVPVGTTVDFKFQPFDNKVVELAWESQNDKKPNLVEFLMQPSEKDRIEIRDEH